ncbi:uncharacterized protein [Ptychodera flava]|uniref:uncharacterized protein n=1 Tax=Ptychodera flava TaxID=63121 RepID=UPI00396A0D0D
MSRLLLTSTFLLSLLVVLQNLPFNRALCSGNPRPQVSLGDATSECDLDSSYCAKFGLEFACTDNYGPPHRCRNKGENVICDSPDIKLPDPTPATTLKVLAYNVWELRYTYYQKGQYERTCRIPQKIFELHGDLDVIVFNEVFMGGCFAFDGISFRDMLEQYGFGYITQTVGEDVSLLPIAPALPPSLPEEISGFENGGVFIASRWPIVAEAEKIFENAVRPSADALSNKGAVYVKIRKEVDSETRHYHILGTHLQAGFGVQGDGARAAQAKEMHTLMKEQNIPADEPVIYAGDLNTELDDADGRWDQMLEVLEAKMPNIVGELDVTYDYENNDLRAEPGEGGKWIDYVIYSNQHAMPNSASQESIKYVASEPFEPCMAALPISQTDPDDGLLPIPIELGQHHYSYQNSCRDSWNVTDLSDHYAVLGVFDFTSPIEPVPNPTQPPIPAECEDDRPQVWLGHTTNECNLTPDYCQMFGLEYVCSARYNNWDLCYVFPGQNVLCAIPKLTLPDPTPATTFKVLAYNVYELRYLYYQSGQHERTCRILPEIFTRHGDLDAIIFNEAFMGGCFAHQGASFRQMLEYYGFKYYTGTIGEDLFLPPENGGVFIASRWPIKRWDETVYESVIAPSDDAMAAKGAMYAEIEKSVDGETRTYHVLGTHLQAGDTDRGGDQARLNQTIEMHNLMLRQNISKEDAVIYGGDLNNNMYTKPDLLDDMLEALEANMPEIVGPINCTSDKCYNDLNYDGDDPVGCAEGRDWLPGSWIDYVLYSHAHRLPSSASQESIKYVDDAFPICFDGIRLFSGHLYPYEENCRENRTITDLADHYAVLGRFEYDSNPKPEDEVSSASAMYSSVLMTFVSLFLQRIV